MVSINDLKQDHKNARKRTDRSAKLIAESLQRYGAARSIVIDEDNRILAGNGTIQGAKTVGIKNLRIIETDGTEVIAVKRTGLSEDEKVGLALADNRTSDLSDWDAEMLQQLSEEHDITPWFEGEDLSEIIGEVEQLPEEGNTDPDEAPEAPEDPITKPGDLWVLGNHRLLCGDSTNIQHVERLMDGKRADMVFTDPPYALFGNSTGTTVADDKMIRPFFRDIGKSIFLASKKGAHFYSCLDWKSWAAVMDSYSGAGLTIKNMIVWDKAHGALGQAYRSQHELIMFGVCANVGISITATAGVSNDHQISDVNVWQCPREPKLGMHAALKPQDLIKRALNNSSSKNDLVLDLFGGSGSTLIACQDTSRKCRMMEMEPKYCDVIVKRWEDFTGNTAVCEPSEAHFNQEQQEAF
jgi:DNA modification methylase